MRAASDRIKVGRSVRVQQPGCEVVDGDHFGIALSGDVLSERVQPGVVDKCVNRVVSGGDVAPTFFSNVIRSAESARKMSTTVPRCGNLDFPARVVSARC